MKILDYYFIKEFQWKSKWFSEKGLLKAKIYPTNDFIQKHRFIDFDLIGQVFYNKELKSVDSTELIISEIKKVITLETQQYKISNEFLALEIGNEYTIPIDYFGDSEGIEVPLSWNISTPKELQYIPTVEILQLFEDWKVFLTEQNRVILK